MEWKSVKLFVASAITLAVVSQVAKKIYNKFTANENKTVPNKDIEKVRTKRREINDVLIFPDNVSYHYIKMSSNSDGKQGLTKTQQNSQKLMKYLKSAQQTLDVCMYLITSNEISESIIRLGQRHVMVRVIVDGDMAYSGGSQVKRLKQYSFIRVQCSKNSRLMHHKFCVIDGPDAITRKHRLIEHAETIQTNAIETDHKTRIRTKTLNIKGFVMSGSLNWSTQALQGSCDSVIVTSQPQVVQKFEKEFAKLWEEADWNPLKIIKE